MTPPPPSHLATDPPRPAVYHARAAEPRPGSSPLPMVYEYEGTGRGILPDKDRSARATAEPDLVYCAKAGAAIGPRCVVNVEVWPVGYWGQRGETDATLDDRIRRHALVLATLRSAMEGGDGAARGDLPAEVVGTYGLGLEPGDDCSRIGSVLAHADRLARLRHWPMYAAHATHLAQSHYVASAAYELYAPRRVLQGVRIAERLGLRPLIYLSPDYHGRRGAGLNRALEEQIEVCAMAGADCVMWRQTAPRTDGPIAGGVTDAQREEAAKAEGKA